jgi:hypothetical protein
MSPTIFRSPMEFAEHAIWLMKGCVGQWREKSPAIMAKDYRVGKCGSARPTVAFHFAAREVN